MAEITDFRLGRIADLRFPAGANFALNSTFTGISLTGKTAILTARSPGQSVVWTRSGLTVGATTINFNIAPSGVDDSSRVFSSFCESGLTDYALTIYEPGGEITMRLQGTVEWAPPTGDFDAGTADSASVSVAVNAGAPVSVDVVSGATGSTTLDTNTVTSGLSGILKAASNTLEVATAGTDYVATNDSRLTDARTPTSHVHGGISNAGAIGSTSGLPIKTGASGVLEAGAFGTSAGQFTEGNDPRLSDARTPTSHVHGGISNAGAIGSTAGLPIKTGTSGVLEAGAFGTSAGQFAQGNDSRFHDRSHAMTSTSDHTAGNWKVFHSNGSGQLVELALGADGTYLKSNGASAAPTFATPAGGGSSITGTGIAYVRTGGNDTTGTIGNPSLPYLTAQAAWDDGARSFDFGLGAFTITHTSDVASVAEEAVFVRGVGKEDTTLTLNWNGIDGIDGITNPTPPHVDATSGVEPSKLLLSSDKSLLIALSMRGGNGGDGRSGEGAGQGLPGANGGDLPEITAFNCCFQSLSIVVGTAGLGGIGGPEDPANVGIPGSPGDNAFAEDNFDWCDLPVGFTLSGSGNILACLQGTNLVTNDIFFGANYSEATTQSLDTIIGALRNGSVTNHYMRTDDFFDNTGTISNVTGLSCSVAANEKILIEIVGFRVGGAAGSGLQIAFTGPSSPTHVRYTLEHWNAVNTGRTVAAATAFNTTLNQADGNTDTLPFRATLTLINGSSPDTVQFRAASENSGTTITLLKGLTMRVHRIP